MNLFTHIWRFLENQILGMKWLRTAIDKGLSALGLKVEVEYITDMEKIMEYGVMSMPAIVVNDKVVSAGKVLKEADVEALLRRLGE